MAHHICHTVAMMVAVVVLAMGVAAVDEMIDCGEQVTELMPCLPFIEGEGQMATAVCCANAKTVVTNSFRCLCVIIKDRDSLGFQINVDRAVMLPVACNVPANISTCIGLLKLPSTSSAAREFLEFEQQIIKNEQAKGNSSSAQASSIGASSSLPSGGGGEGMIASLLLICLSFWAF
ncbi:hypothetical protein HPP92_009372 [Vanilla planifolia]|uniref:Bifunctional inhibitor/plant lipid transfer protein/seed storage helical domain-containing protein n=1 Tax=Vanilla planifolia TaxID=51239 RepID=A0A835RJN4_VANPL|nr:hypothetical protein HPP92_009372 [Vanilla planifolia]